MTIYHFVTRVELSLGQRGHMQCGEKMSLCFTDMRAAARRKGERGNGRRFMSENEAPERKEMQWGMTRGKSIIEENFISCTAVMG